MPQLVLEGVPVEFPFTPYDVQKDYMTKVIQALQTKGTHALLESPTGTGKTLCLLCASLAWREHYKLQQDVAAAKKVTAGGVASFDNAAQAFGMPTDGPPRIIYTSRTHSQLTQVMKELNACAYSPRMAVLGSREQMCIHPEVSRMESNAEMTQACKQRVENRQCIYYFKANEMGSKGVTNVTDIEDIVSKGRENMACPYYMCKNSYGSAEIVFMPYNYLIDPELRHLQGIDVTNCIIIIDEGHNINQVCEDIASFDITTEELQKVFKDCYEAAEALQNMTNEEREGFKVKDPKSLKALAANVLKLADEIKDRAKKNTKMEAVPGKEMFDLLNTFMLVNFSNRELVNTVLSGAVEILNRNSVEMAETGSVVRHRIRGLCTKAFADILLKLFGPGSEDHLMHYQLFIREKEKKKGPRGFDDVAGDQAILSLWCLSPRFGVQNILDGGARNLIITSGTLSPLESFAAEMDVPFPITLENSHVIDKQQVWVGVLRHGVGGFPLSSKYDNRSSIDYINDLGESILQVARYIPDGLLVFFPSYSVLSSCIEQWQKPPTISDGQSIWDRLKAVKTPVLEPREKTKFKPAIEQYYKLVKDPKDDTSGAAFFAVTRGKVSEGLDFAGSYGRAVIVTGLPFPPLHDPRVKLKRSFLDKHKGTNGLSGGQWYSQEALRAVNQAIGRVIRHKNDYGAIILADDRFAQKGVIGQLSKWVRPNVQVFDDFDRAAGSVSRFFRDISLLPIAKMTNHKPRIKAVHIPISSTKDTNEITRKRKAGESHRNAKAEASDDLLNTFHPGGNREQPKEPSPNREFYVADHREDEERSRRMAARKARLRGDLFAGEIESDHEPEEQEATIPASQPASHQQAPAKPVNQKAPLHPSTNQNTRPPANAANGAKAPTTSQPGTKKADTLKYIKEAQTQLPPEAYKEFRQLIFDASKLVASGSLSQLTTRLVEICSVGSKVDLAGGFVDLVPAQARAQFKVELQKARALQAAKRGLKKPKLEG